MTIVIKLVIAENSNGEIKNKKEILSIILR